MQTPSAPRYISRSEYIDLVLSNRPLTRIVLEDKRLHELIDRQTNEHFQIRETDLFPSFQHEDDDANRTHDAG